MEIFSSWMKRACEVIDGVASETDEAKSGWLEDEKTDSHQIRLLDVQTEEDNGEISYQACDRH